jgi:hypothetical protein
VLRNGDKSRIERLRHAGQQHEEDPEGRILRRAVEGDMELLALPHPHVRRPGEDRARR